MVFALKYKSSSLTKLCLKIIDTFDVMYSDALGFFLSENVSANILNIVRF